MTNETSPQGLMTWEANQRQLENISHTITLYHPESGRPIEVNFTPPILKNRSPLLDDRNIELVAVDRLIRHEGFLRPHLKKVTFRDESGEYRWRDAPLVVVKDNDGNYMVIDGSTRLGRIQKLSSYVIDKCDSSSAPVFPVQVVDYYSEDLILDIWETHHTKDKLLTKEAVFDMAKNGLEVEPKQTKFGVKVNKRVISIAQAQGEVHVGMSQLLGIKLNPTEISKTFYLQGLLQ